MLDLSSSICSIMHSITIYKKVSFCLLGCLFLLAGCATDPGVVENPISPISQELTEAEEAYDYSEYPNIEGSSISEEVPQEPVTPTDSAPFAVDQSAVSADAICVGEEGTDSEVVDSVNKALLATPRWLRNMFVNSGWEMKVVNYDIATVDYDGKFDEGMVYGSTSYLNRTIKILNDMKASANSPIHEFGHWFDSRLGYPSFYSEGFKSIYEAESDSYKEAFGPTCSWDRHEFLAEGFGAIGNLHLHLLVPVLNFTTL